MEEVLLYWEEAFLYYEEGLKCMVGCELSPEGCYEGIIGLTKY